MSRDGRRAPIVSSAIGTAPASERIGKEMAGSSKRAIFAALMGNLLIAMTKFVASGITGSSAMLSEGIHSIVDTGNQVLLLLGLRRAAKPPDPRFPFGHAREVYFWSFIVAILIFGLGAGISIYQGIHHVLHPKSMESPLVNYIVLAFAILFEGGALLIASKEFAKAKGDRGVLEAIRRGKDPTLFVVLFEDSAALLGLLVALVGIGLAHKTGHAEFDGAASILVGLILAGTATWLAYETKGLLIGESADPGLVAGIEQILLDNQQVEHVNELLTMHMGPNDILVNVSVRLRGDITSQTVQEEISRLDHGIKRLDSRIKRVFIEAERMISDG